VNRVAIVVGVVLVACGRGPAAKAPDAPAAIVKQEIAAAEEAEKRRRHDVAREHYEKAVAAAHDPDSIAFARHEFADTLHTWGEDGEALVQLEAAVAAKPDDAGSWNDIGFYRHAKGDNPGAVQALERARMLAPTDVRPRKALAQLRWKLGDRAGAAAEYRAMLELDLPDNLRKAVQWALVELAKP
jgi:Flp pilus assembly protein TadD